jgi:hypothetical protein
MAINLVYLIASMLVQAKAQADAEKAGNNARRVASERKDVEQERISSLMDKNLEQYQNTEEDGAMAQIIADKVAPAVKSIDSTTNFEDVDRFGSQGSSKSTAYQDALTGAITDVADKAKTKAGMLAKVKAPTHMRRDQAVSSADNIQQQGIIGKKANDWYNNVSRLDIQNAYKPSEGMMLLSQALGAYATMGADGGATTGATAGANAGANAGKFTEVINGIPIVDKTAMDAYNANLASAQAYSPNASNFFR